MPLAENHTQKQHELQPCCTEEGHVQASDCYLPLFFKASVKSCTAGDVGSLVKLPRRSA